MEPCSEDSGESTQCVCGKCGKEALVIGYETSEQLDVEPAKYFVRVIKREKRACKASEEQGVGCWAHARRKFFDVVKLIQKIRPPLGSWR